MFSFLVDTLLGHFFGNVSLLEAPVLFIGLLATVAFFRIEEPFKESKAKQICLILIGLGILALAF